MFREENNYKKATEAYISEIDKCFADFDKKHAWSATQLSEVAKHKRIFCLRDGYTYAIKEKVFWNFD